MLAALLGIVFGIVRTLLQDFEFKLWAEGERFRRERGLFTRSEVALPKRRVQLARLTSGPLRSRFDWSAMFFQTLSIGKDGSGQQVVAPLARKPEVARILAEQRMMRLPASDELEMVSSRRLWRLLIGHVTPWVLLFAAATAVVPLAGLFFLLLPAILAVALIERRFHRYGVADDLLFIRHGVIRRQLWIVPVAKIQSMALRRNPLQRLLGLATLLIDTAGASKLGGPRIADLAEARSRALLAQLSGRNSATER